MVSKLMKLNNKNIKYYDLMKNSFEFINFLRKIVEEKLKM